MPAAIPLHVLHSRLISAEALVRAADRVVATYRARAEGIAPIGDRSRTHLEELEHRIRETRQRHQTAVRDAAHALAEGARCALERAEVMALVRDIEESTSV